ncbi:RNA polymerase sigma factor [Rhizobium sp. TRM96647]|uniref:RNA polymerase sigma factor n=1 Tax=unclassified Rhizobium TaxID=2613769 RepID=UPI0021E8EF4D|nr:MULTISPECIES: RNA polymerase sigma factor [unclassified Rhizobium]MCV3736957.1 RNA polymerase sigma factor [Rhizobium sp. TRM96647]MCV3756643.1 RNA polymerase sigma factor [Rhizobium sp. TRM96650]
MIDDTRTVPQRLVAFLPNLRRFAISLCRSPELADDLVQAACERAIRSAGSFSPESRFDAWMFRILRNLWIDHLRRAKTAGPHQELDEAGDILGPDGQVVSHARLDLLEVTAALMKLPEEQREVLVLVCVEDLSYRETADVLSIPIGTVMSRLARARKNLARLTGIDAGDERSSGTKGGMA